MQSQHSKIHRYAFIVILSVVGIFLWGCDNTPTTMVTHAMMSTTTTTILPALLADKVLIDKLNKLYKMGGTDPSKFGVSMHVEDAYKFCDIQAKITQAGLKYTESWKHDENPFKVLPHFAETTCKMSESETKDFWKHKVLFGGGDRGGYNPLVASSFINQKVSSPYSKNVTKDKYPGGRICIFNGWSPITSPTGHWGYVFDEEYAVQKPRCMYLIDAATEARSNGGCGRGMPACKPTTIPRYPKCIENYSMETDKGKVSYFKDDFLQSSDTRWTCGDRRIFGEEIQEVEGQFNDFIKKQSPLLHPWTPDNSNEGSCNKGGRSPHFSPFYRGAGFRVKSGDQQEKAKGAVKPKFYPSTGHNNAQQSMQRPDNLEMSAGMKVQEDSYSCSYYWRTWNLGSGPTGSSEITPEEYTRKELWRINPWPKPQWRDMSLLCNVGFNEVVYDRGSLQKELKNYIEKAVERSPLQAFFFVCNMPNYWDISPRRVQEKFAERYGLQVSPDEPRVPRVVFFDLYDTETPFKAECPSSKDLCSKAGGKFCTRLTGDPQEQEKDLIPIGTDDEKDHIPDDEKDHIPIGTSYVVPVFAACAGALVGGGVMSLAWALRGRRQDNSAYEAMPA